MKKVIFFLWSLTVLFCQEPCEGTCLSEEETKNLFNNINECEYKDSLNIEIQKNLEKEIQMYIQTGNLNRDIITALEQKIELQNDLIKITGPKWYENKWLWFTLGAITTAGTLKLASDIVD
tara:strand:- start:533 stop:895 length:363 start_codon:yes stop_codon:yes gene_type:complete